MLYPSREDYLHDIVVNSLHVRGADLSVLDEGWYRWVRLEGEFNLVKNSDKPWFGVINSPTSVVKVVGVKPESPEELHIDMEFLK